LPCIHGIDEINCPICRISRVSTPKSSISQIKSNQDNFLIKSPFLNEFLSKKEDLEEVINKKVNLFQPNLINPLPTPNLINQIPPFENKTLLNQLNTHDIEKLDGFGISKKISVKKGELEFK
jgi:hypothetical protein